MSDAKSPDDDPLAERTLASRLAFEGVFLRLYVDRVQSADGHTGTREYLRHPGAVMIIPLLDAEHVLLERQFRYPLGRAVVEFPAGKIDPGEPPFECAKRELLEETGYTARRWSYLGGLHNAIGYSDEKIEIFLAEDLERGGDAALDAGETLEVFEAPWRQLLEWVRDGSVTDVKTMVGVLWLEKTLAGEWSRRAPEDVPARDV
jgi:ADP-ribose pyrophosphatase